MCVFIYKIQIIEGNLILTVRKNIKYVGHFHTPGGVACVRSEGM